MSTNPVPPLNTEMRLRDAASADVDAVVALINAAFVAERFFFDQDRIDSAGVRDLMLKGRFLLAEDGIGLAGCVYIELRGERSYFGLLSVDPNRQRTGIGRFLVAAAEEACRNLGCRIMDILVVNLRAELPHIYRKLGYAETGTEPFPPDVQTKLPCHFLVMSKVLT